MTDHKLKIFVDAHPFDTIFQGSQSFLRELYTALDKNYPDIEIYYGVYNTANFRKIFPFVDPSRILSYGKISRGVIRLLVDIPAYIKKYKFDFAHFQYFTPFHKNGCKYILTIHDILFNDFKSDFSWSYRFKRNFLFRKSIENADITTTVSGYSRNRITEYYQRPYSNVHVISHGIDPTFGNLYCNKEKAREKIKQKFGLDKFILFVSRIEPRKNHLLLLNKYLELELYKRNISLVFIGDESIKVPGLHKVLDKLDNKKKKFLRWYSQISQEELHAFYNACLIFVYPSKAEGFGIPPLEAALCEAPVLCSRSTAMMDFDFFSPFTFDPENEIEFGNKLINEIENPPNEEFLKKVSEQVIQKYSSEKSAAIFYDLIKSNITS